MGNFKNEFSWSKSRDDVFCKCLRQYYFQYYGSWGGWNLDSLEKTREIYILKQLKTRQMWSGSLVHECIERMLQNLQRNIKPMDEEKAIDATIAIMRKDYASSRDKFYRDNPKSCALFEHEYEIDISDDKWKAEAEHVKNCLKTFYRSDVYFKLNQLLSDQWLEIENFSFFYIDGVKVYAVLDCSFRDGDDIYIYDWKTGKTDTEQNELQLACYTFYAIGKWNVTPKQVKAIEFNLASGKEVMHQLNTTELASIQEYIRGSVRDMKLLLDDPETNKASEDKFAMTKNDATCNYCNYKKVCPKWNE